MRCRPRSRRTVLGDISLLRRMVVSLVENALQHTEKAGTIRITVDAASEGTTIAVADTGSGIDAVHLPHIFERFYRCDKSRSERGAGLGLPLVRTVAREHGGRVAVDSHPGAGSVFTVTLPTA